MAWKTLADYQLHQLPSMRLAPMIAIVDDDDSVRNGMATLLRSLGHSVAAFGSAEAFLESGQVSTTTCLITDLHMPGMSGLDLQKRLIEEGHRIPVIFLTGFPDENVRNRAIKAGALAFLNKPLVQHDLVESLEKALKVN
jgi:FixJ family two-component response regulator